MFRKIVFYAFGFGLGAFMLLNSAVAFYRFLHGYRLLAPSEWMVSSIITFLVGTILIIWTCLLFKK